MNTFWNCLYWITVYSRKHNHNIVGMSCNNIEQINFNVILKINFIGIDNKYVSYYVNINVNIISEMITS